MENEEFERRVKKMSKQQVEMIIAYRDGGPWEDLSPGENIGCMHTFDKGEWRFYETDDHYVMVKIAEGEEKDPTKREKD